MDVGWDVKWSDENAIGFSSVAAVQQVSYFTSFRWNYNKSTEIFSNLCEKLKNHSIVT